MKDNINAINHKYATQNMYDDNYNDNTSDQSNVVNLSSKTFTEEHTKILEKSLNFIPTPKKLNCIEHITNTEQSLFHTPNLLKKAAINEITTFLKRWKYKPRYDNLTKNERKTLNDIKNMKDIIILPADKGRKVVIMNHTDYITNIKRKLNEDNTYEQVQIHRTKLRKTLQKQRINYSNKIKLIKE